MKLNIYFLRKLPPLGHIVYCLSPLPLLLLNVEILRASIPLNLSSSNNGIGFVLPRSKMIIEFLVMKKIIIYKKL